MSAVILLLTIGGWLIYSSLKGQSLTEALTGEGGDNLNPKGHVSSELDITDSPLNDPLGGLTGKTGQFKGPHAALLFKLSQIAESKYHLKISQICRPASASYGSPTSLHKSCRAFDSVGAVADKVAFARYAKTVPGVAEVFCDQAGMVAPGYDHSDHVHVGA